MLDLIYHNTRHLSYIIERYLSKWYRTMGGPGRGSQTSSRRIRAVIDV